MAFKLPPELHEKIERDRRAYDDQRIAFTNLNDADLVTSIKFWMQHCVAPKHVEAGTPVYDSTFWHILVPEMIRRLSER